MIDFALTISCPDRPGVVAGVSDFLFKNGMNITEHHQFSSGESGDCFMRSRFSHPRADKTFKDLQSDFEPIAEHFKMHWQLHDMTVKPKVLLLVSKFDHCLFDLIYRARIGALNMEIVGVFSNHEITRPYVEHENIPFTYCAVNRDTKEASENRIKELMKIYGAELIILARYMQVLSPEFTASYLGQIINIHHSFLPSFKGAVPYSRAFERGVKMIGATAHYITENLDEGPIITQNVVPVRHDTTIEKMISMGREVEQQVLADAVGAHTERRILLNGHKTVVFT